MKQPFNIKIQEGICTLISYNGTDRELIMPDSVERIGRNAFLKCRTLHSLILSPRLKYIDTEAFHCCDHLETITFAEGLLEIGSRAFWYCSSLRKLFFPKSVQVIGSRAFECCSNLETITLLNPGTFVDEYAFNETPYWNRLLKEALTCASGADPAYCPKSLVLPEGITHIDVWYYSKSSITSAYLPNSLRTIGMSAFQNCSRLTEVSMSPNTYCNSGYTASGAADEIFAGCTELEQVTFRGPLKNFTWYNASQPELLRGFDPEKTFIGCNRLKRMIGWEIPLACYPLQWQYYAIQGYLADMDRDRHYLPEVSASYDRHLAGMSSQLLKRTARDHSLALHQYLARQHFIDKEHYGQIFEQAIIHGDADVISLLLEYKNRFLKTETFEAKLLAKLDQLDEL